MATKQCDNVVQSGKIVTSLVTENLKCVYGREDRGRGEREGREGGGKGEGKGEGERLLTPCLEFPLEFSIKVFQLCCECE